MAGDEKMLDALEEAIEIEERGRRFYEKAADTTDNALGKKIFRMLLESEREHIERIKSMCEALRKGRALSRELVKCPVEASEVKRLFESIYEQQKEVIEAGADDAEAAKVGMEFEKATMDFYKKRLAEATDPLEREFLESMIIEEELHYKALAELHAYFTDPEGWLEEKQGFKMDSG